MRIQILIRVWGAFVFLSNGFKTVHPDFHLKLWAQKTTTKNKTKKKLASTVDEDTPSA